MRCIYRFRISGNVNMSMSINYDKSRRENVPHMRGFNLVFNGGGKLRYEK
jgi:hypothetical protein